MCIDFLHFVVVPDVEVVVGIDGRVIKAGVVGGGGAWNRINSQFYKSFEIKS